MLTCDLPRCIQDLTPCVLTVFGNDTLKLKAGVVSPDIVTEGEKCEFWVDGRRPYNLSPRNESSSALWLDASGTWALRAG